MGKIDGENDEQGNERIRPWLQELTAEERAKFDTFLLYRGERRAPAPRPVEDESADGTGRRSGDGSADTSFSVIGGGGGGRRPGDTGGTGKNAATALRPGSPFDGALHIPDANRETT